MTTAVFLAPLSVAGGPLFIPGTVSPAAGGQLFTYITGTSTKLNTYTTSSGAVANANPIVLDSGGFVTGSGEVWLIQSSSYRFILAPSTDTDPPASPYWTRDSVSGINDVQTQINGAGQEWIAASTTPVFGNASSFVISGDQRSTFTVGRRVKTTNTGGTVYGTITSSVFTTSTAVGIAPDSGGLDAGLSAVSYGLLSTPDGSMPWTNVTANGNTLLSSTSIINLYSTTASISSLSLSTSFTSINGVSSVGKVGVPVITAIGRVTSQVTSAIVTTFTVGAVDSSYEVGAHLTLIASSSHNFQLFLTYTDENRSGQQLVMNYISTSNPGSTGATISSGGLRSMPFLTVQIRTGSSTIVTMSTSGNFASVTYNAEAIFKRLN